GAPACGGAPSYAPPPHTASGPYPSEADAAPEGGGMAYDAPAMEALAEAGPASEDEAAPADAPAPSAVEPPPALAPTAQNPAPGAKAGAAAKAPSHAEPAAPPPPPKPA